MTHLDDIARADENAHHESLSPEVLGVSLALQQASMSAFEGIRGDARSEQIKTAVHVAASGVLLKNGCGPDTLRELDGHFQEAERRLRVGACCHGAMAGSSHIEESRLSGIRAAISEQLLAQADTTLSDARI